MLHLPADSSSVSYFSMEVAVDPSVPTYSGGLGILAGDMLRSAADLAVPVAGVTLLHRKGYIRQHLDEAGRQSESPSLWSPESMLEPLSPRVSVMLEGREVQVRAWRYGMRGLNGFQVPIYFLDTALPENTPWDQTLTDHLYGGDERYRLCQEVVLGFGGVAMLEALGYARVQPYHLNEGHSALLTLALLERQIGDRHLEEVGEEDTEAVRKKCAFTTHTPVEAGHDRFPLELVGRVLGEKWSVALQSKGLCLNGYLNMTYLALRLSRYVNGVTMRHSEVSRDMFPGYPINAITNGVHAETWTSPGFASLYDRYVSEWRYDNFYLRYAIGIPVREIQQAHREEKRLLIREVTERSGKSLSEEVLTIGFARRATPYKRADLLFSDPDRLRDLANRAGPLQVIYGGKAHPQDEGGKAIIHRIFETAKMLGPEVRVVYLEDYDMALAKRVCAGVDLWLNTPQRPHEASGTSGMKAAMNGVPSFSVLDGWWIEGHIEGVTGWSIEGGGGERIDPASESQSLYQKLETVIAPLYYSRPEDYAGVMRSVIALNGSFFNTQRLVSQYLRHAYVITNNGRERS